MHLRTDRKGGRSLISILAIGLLAGAGMPSFAGVRWTSDIEQAVKAASRTGKPLLLKFSTEWCHYCVKMDRETFTDVRVSQKVKSCFIPLKIDGDRHRGLASQLGVRSFPTLMVISPKEGLVGRIRGYRSAKQLRSDLSTICSHDDRALDASQKETPPSRPLHSRGRSQWKAVPQRDDSSTPMVGRVSS